MQPASVVALVSVLLVAPGCGADRSPTTSGTSCDRPAILFVHGLGQDGSIFAPIIETFVTRGLPAACLGTVAIVPDDSSNVRAAESFIAPRVSQLLESLRDDLPAACRKVHLVAHSMGALSARWYASRVRPDAIAGLITTSGANHGTNWNCGKRIGPGHREMCPAFAATRAESSVQYGLNGSPAHDLDETPWGLGRDARGVDSVRAGADRQILYATIRTRNDPYIVPERSMELDGAGGLAAPQWARAEFIESSAGNFVIRAPTGHDDLLKAPQVHRLVFDLVSARDGAVCGTHRAP